MFQDGSIDDLLSNFDENFLLDVASQVGFPPIVPRVLFGDFAVSVLVQIVIKCEYNFINIICKNGIKYR